MTTLERIINEGTETATINKELLIGTLKEIKAEAKRAKTDTTQIAYIFLQRAIAKAETRIKTLYYDRKMTLKTMNFLNRLIEQMANGRNYRKEIE